jgi:signal transduction histidine kinase
MHRFNHHPPHVHAAAFALDRGRQMERERIMRDLHDGVAGNLFGLKQMLGRANVSRPQILQEMESVMDEMRMTIDSLQPSNNDLGTILATLRYRLQPRLEAAGIRIIWRLPELHSEIIIAPEKIFHVQKILMEALTNVQKHSGASNVWVQMEVPSSAVQTGQAVISIEDDGGGMAPAVDTSHGVGLESMKARADAVGAELSVGHGPRGGTLVTLRVRWQPDA